MRDWLRCKYYWIFGPWDSIYWRCPRCGRYGTDHRRKP